VGKSIFVIGNLGYMGERHFGTTQMYHLSIKTFEIEAVETFGESPGWICRHKSKLVGNTIEVCGGKVCSWVDGKEAYEDNHERFFLDLGTMSWSKLS
jgi:hypothetical protein